MNARLDIADEISGIVVGEGYYATSIGIDAALEAADTLIAAGYAQTPAAPTDAMVLRAAQVIAGVTPEGWAELEPTIRAPFITTAQAALEAALTAR